MEWWLYTHCATAGAPTAVLTDPTTQPTDETEPEETNEPTSATLYDTALTTEEGLWARSSWIGDH